MIRLDPVPSRKRQDRLRFLGESLPSTFDTKYPGSGQLPFGAEFAESGSKSRRHQHHRNEPSISLGVILPLQRRRGVLSGQASCQRRLAAVGCRARVPMSICGKRRKSRLGGDGDRGGQRAVRIDCPFAHRPWVDGR